MQQMRRDLSSVESAVDIGLQVVQHWLERDKDAENADEREPIEWLAKYATEHNIRTVFEHSESPIERELLLHLAIGIASTRPLSAIFRGAISDAERWITNYRASLSGFNASWRLYRQHAASKSYVDWCMTFSREHPELGNPDPKDLVQAEIEHRMRVHRSYQILMQAGLPSIRIDGRGIRLDALAVIPASSRPGVAIEADGYEWHSSKQTFASDRKRDRALQSAGYQVVRFSGSEIYSQPQQAALDLYEALRSARDVPEPYSDEDVDDNRDLLEHPPNA